MKTKNSKKGKTMMQYREQEFDKTNNNNNSNNHYTDTYNNDHKNTHATIVIETKNHMQ